MHDIDRTQLETGYEGSYGETPLGEIFNEYGFGSTSQESDESYGFMGELSEEEVMELAAELLEAQDEYEVDQFLGKLFKKVGRAVGGAAKSVASSVAPVLKGVVKQAVPILKQAAGAALPLAGAAAGGFFGGPLGAKIGSHVGGALGNAFGLEFEGMSAEDREFEGAKQIVRLAESAIKQAAQAAPNVTPQVVQNAVTNAASQFMPGLLRPRPSAGGGQGRAGHRGTWVRAGNRIILSGV